MSISMKDAVNQMTDQQIVACAEICDGHTIFDPEAMTDLGFPKEAVESVSSVYKSDGSPKGSITDTKTGESVKEMRGIYGLDFLKSMARSLNVEYKSAMGRGFLARNIKRAICDHVASKSGGSA